MPESLLNKVIGFYPATSLKKKGLQYGRFLMNFAKYLRHLFYGAPPDDSASVLRNYILPIKQ